MSKKRVALITVWFPPTNGVAVNRMKSFANYLSDDFFMEVFTLGTNEECVKTDFGMVHSQVSRSFYDKIKHNSTDGKLKHHFKTMLNLLAMNLGVSKHKKWKNKTLDALFKRHREAPFDVLISSYAPTDPHDIVVEFKQEFPDVVWIADMRDEMSSNPFLSDKQRNMLRKKENKYAQYISGLTTVSGPILEDFKKVYPVLSEFAEIRNGFDHEVEPIQGRNKVFTIVYAGMFYGKRKPNLFFEAVLNALRNNRVEKDFKVIFVGTSNNFNIPSGLKNCVEFVPSVSYEKAITYMRDADCNLLINPPLGTLGQFSGKVFDYLSVEKPILALVDKKDVAAALIEDHNGGVSANFYDITQIEDAFCELYGFWKRKEDFPINRLKTMELHRKHQVLKLENFIIKLLK
ncbi:MAG: hypothetical protein HOH13_02080 [Crocinitomicaceae bacterium]|jgi:hypothetical protein|nr:hypothetical protein [Crocinitomicaceae bacterium]MBT6515616.1 hypothetical protein [Crocinitomicaceae bacterium]